MSDTERRYYRIEQALLVDGKWMYAGGVIREDDLDSIRRESAALLKGRTDLRLIVWEVTENVVDRLGFPPES